VVLIFILSVEKNSTMGTLPLFTYLGKTECVVGNPAFKTGLCVQDMLWSTLLMKQKEQKHKTNLGLA
jgi:hypothetical protein